ncbi:hypothetical protein DL96DRAFT_1620586 [Flagelloscypha sp. PMI_526]|nr:hypothetical protein DL96DRAFT_1620586 [Flagelloscypha sp. PMI_526]
MTVFPQELYQKIISLLENDSMALSHLALVDSKFRLMSQSLMWHTLRVETYRKSSRHPDGNLTSGDVQDLLSFLHEENSRCLLHLVSTAYIGVFSLVTLELVEEFGPIFTELVNLRLLKLYGEWSRMPIFLPSAIYSLLLEANTICPSMNVLCLQAP